MSKNIVIIGSALSGNKGAAAMLESSIQTLSQRYPNARFTSLSMYPHADRQQNPYKNLEIIDGRPFQLGVIMNVLALLHRILPFARGFITRRSPAIRAIVEADVFLDQSGITFVDGREKFLPFNTAAILPPINLKTPVVKCAQALGPFNNPINRACAKFFLPRMAAVVSRGAVTTSHLASLGLKNVIEGADYAFALELTDKEVKSAQERYDISFFKDSKVVGLSPSVVMRKKVEAAGDNYVLQMVEFIDYLAEKGLKTMLVAHSVRTGTDKTHNNDLPLCREIYAKIKHPQKCLFIDQELSSQELRYWIGECDYFVASRFHAMVSSLAMKVPTLVIGWSHKYREVLEMFELDEWAFGHQDLTKEHLQGRFEKLVENADDIKKKLTRNLPSVKKLSLQQVDVIADVIENK